MLHRARIAGAPGTMLSNACAALAELGIVSAKGRNGTAELLRIIADAGCVPAVCGISRCWAAVWRDRHRDSIHRQEHHGPCTAGVRRAGGWRRSRHRPDRATALVAEIGDWKTFSSGRSVAAWIGWCRSSTHRRQGQAWQHHQAGHRYLRWLWWSGQWPLSATRASTERRSVPGSAIDERRPRKWRRGAPTDCADGLGHHGSGREIQEPKLLLVA